MVASFVCPTWKETRLFCAIRATKELKASFFLLSLVSRFNRARLCLTPRTFRKCRGGVIYVINEVTRDEEDGYQYLEETFGVAQSFVKKKQKSRKYDPSLFWEHFLEKDSGNNNKRSVGKKWEASRDMNEKRFANSRNPNIFGKLSKRSYWQKPIGNDQVEELCEGNYTTVCPLARLDGLEAGQTVALIYLRKSFSDLDLRKLLDLVKSTVPCRKVTLVLKGVENDVPPEYKKVVEVSSEVNYYVDKKGCFFEEKDLTCDQSCCVILTCNEAGNSSHSIRQIVDSLPNSLLKILFYDARGLREHFCSDCLKSPESLTLNKEHNVDKSLATPQIQQRCVVSEKETLKRNQAKEDKARIVVNHSTHIPGLIKTLEVLSQEPCVQTIVPGRLRNGKSRSPHLLLRVTTKTHTGFKLLARKGTTVQEVFIVTSAERQVIEGIVNKVNKLTTA